MKYFLGIDPGRSGGLACLNERGIVKFNRMPGTDGGIMEWLRVLPTNSMTTLVERISPSSFPGTSKGSVAKLYGSYRALLMALTAVGIKYETISAEGWQEGLGIEPRRKNKKTKSRNVTGVLLGESKTEWKQRLKSEAEKRFSELKITLHTSDALLIAHYCREQNRCT